ncbi:HNH endonuclease [Roseovarius albus]|nr:HNH endonuclease [Roseovarius albus]
MLDPAYPDEAGPRELRKLRDQLARGEKLASDDFQAYRNRAVREALREMFHGKCAYCESKIAGSQDTDVEHYRPKKGVSEAAAAGIDHPGYWWLAMVWENLVLSCQHCNQTRSSLVIIPDDIETEEDLASFLMGQPLSRAGKLNAFPTEGNLWITTAEGELSDERPLILNPADVDPERHLDWVLFKGAATVRPKDDSPAGEATRQILGLNRRWLEEDRRIHLLEMREDRNDIIEAINNWLEADNPSDRTRWERWANRTIDTLVRKTDANKPFAGMARAFLAQVQAEVDDMTGPQHG